MAAGSNEPRSRDRVNRSPAWASTAVAAVEAPITRPLRRTARRLKSVRRGRTGRATTCQVARGTAAIAAPKGTCWTKQRTDVAHARPVAEPRHQGGRDHDHQGQ